MSSHQFRVAVVEDDYRVLESLDELLTAAGHQVRLFRLGSQFLEADCTQQIDCLISDIGLPQISGWQLMTVAREKRAELPVILITGREEEQPSAAGKDKHFRFLRKPFDGQELLGLLSQLIQSPF